MHHSAFLFILDETKICMTELENSSMNHSTKNTIKRVLLSAAVFAGIYLASEPIIGWHSYDVYLKGLEFLAAVIGAGCYWIGSNSR